MVSYVEHRRLKYRVALGFIPVCACGKEGTVVQPLNPVIGGGVCGMVWSCDDHVVKAEDLGVEWSVKEVKEEESDDDREDN